MKTLQRISLFTLVLSVCLVLPAFAQNSQQDQYNTGSQNLNEGSVTPPVDQDQPQQDQDRQQDMDKPPADQSQQNNMDRPAVDQNQAPDTEQQSPETGMNAAPTATMPLPSGKKATVAGVIVQRNPDSVVVRNSNGAETLVRISNSTKVEERKNNPFRGARKYSVTQLMRGLSIIADGRADSSGALMADKIRFTTAEYRVAQSVESRVTPVEGQVQADEKRITASEANQQRLSGEIEELNGVANAARGSAKAAQETADMALDAVHTTNDRISALDDYQVRNKAVIHFKVGSAILSPEAKQQLDELARAASAEKGYIIEVAGFASSDGNERLNMALSRRRAEAVVDYLGIQHNIPLRRITMPLGHGANNPVADNSNRSGREENRRVEVSVMVNKGLTEQPAIPSH